MTSANLIGIISTLAALLPSCCRNPGAFHCAAIVCWRAVSLAKPVDAHIPTNSLGRYLGMPRRRSNSAKAGSFRKVSKAASLLIWKVS